MASFDMSSLESALAGLSTTAQANLIINSGMTPDTVSATGLVSSPPVDVLTIQNATDLIVRHRIFREMFQSELRARGLRSLNILQEQELAKKQQLALASSYLGVHTGRGYHRTLSRGEWAWILRAKRKLRAIREQIQKIKELEAIVNMKVNEHMARGRHGVHTPSRENE